jgi:hypothetical protein
MTTTTDTTTLQTGDTVKVLPPRSKNSPADIYTGMVATFVEASGADCLVENDKHAVWITVSRLAIL